VHAQDPQTFATIRSAAAAGQAVAAVEVRLHRHLVTNLHAINSRTDGENLGAEFVAEDAGILEEGLASSEGMQVGAADADAVDADQGVAGSGIARFVGVDAFETTGLGEDEGLQDGLSLLVIGNSFLVVSTDR
jgi:hypothetical protein